MQIKPFITSALLLCLITPALAAKRNVVLFVTDDQSPDFGAYGNPVMKTPHMDALAADGVRFTHAFCTTASCSASRSVILTGLHNHANGQYGHQHHFHKFNAYGNIVSLPTLMSGAGYRTARIGKYHVSPEEVFKFQTVLKGNSRHPVSMANNCRAFLQEAKDDDKPFFLYFCTSDPHRGGGVASELPYKPDRFGNLPNGQARPGIKRIDYKPAEVIVPEWLPDTPWTRAELAQYYTSCSRIDQGLGTLVDVLKQTGQWEDTLFIYISDHGIAMPGAKTTVYEPGMRSPLLVRNPYLGKKGKGHVNHAMVSWVDLTPTILDFAGGLNDKGDANTDVVKKALGASDTSTFRQRTRDTKPGQFHGRSFLPVLDKTRPEGWDQVNASHTFHEITMYYPMRVVRTRKWKLIWNIAHGLPYPFASDLWVAPTWQAQYKQGMDAMYGGRTVKSYIHRPQFELFNLENDPWETRPLADDPKHAKVLEQMKAKLKAFQQQTDDPWIMKWRYE